MNKNNFLYLNLDSNQTLVKLHNMQWRARGELTLTRLPRFDTGKTLPPRVRSKSGRQESAGIGVDSEGNIYIADPVKNCILRVDGCDGSQTPLPCLGGPGQLPGQFNGPCGVLVGPRDALYVADSGNHRVQVFDLRTLQLRGIWGQPDPFVELSASTLPGRFQQPRNLGADRQGYLYVSDPGHQTGFVWQDGRVQKFTPDGCVIQEFWEKMQKSNPPNAPAFVVTAPLLENISGAPTDRLLVLDLQPPRLLVYGLDGTYDNKATAWWADVSRHVKTPSSAVFYNRFLYVGDTDASGVLVFGEDGKFLGYAPGYEGSAVSLCLDRHNRLLVLSGEGGAIMRQMPEAAYSESGSFTAGPFDIGNQPVCWGRLQVYADPLPKETHIQLFTYSSLDENPPPPLPVTAFNSSSCSGRTKSGEWRPAPWDQLDILALNERSRFLYIGAVLQGNETASPVLHQIRLEYDPEGWLQYLPSLYRQNGSRQPFLEQTLALFQSLLADMEDQVEDLPGLFDPAAAPDAWLDWLAGWLAFQLDEQWDEPNRRKALASAFDLQARHGTPEGLRDLLTLYTGVPVQLTEPGRFTTLWTLGSEQSVLGFSTMLAPEHPQGAVLGTTATVDRSHLIVEADDSIPLFDDVAHCFEVQVYAAGLADRNKLERVRQVLDQAKPAHTTYQLHLIEPAFRVGVQAQVGIDAIVAGPAPDLVLGDTRQLGWNTVMAERPDRGPFGGRIGQDTRVGRRTSLA